MKRSGNRTILHLRKLRQSENSKTRNESFSVAGEVSSFVNGERRQRFCSDYHLAHMKPRSKVRSKAKERAAAFEYGRGQLKMIIFELPEAEVRSELR